MNSQNILKRLRHKLRKSVWTPREIARLAKHENPMVGSIGAALLAHCNADLLPEESIRLGRIEQLREQLCGSTECLSVCDYGAGSPEANLSADAMATGRLVNLVLGEACRDYSQPRSWAMLLFQLVRKLKPLNCMELGTCVGISAAYQATALEFNGNGILRCLEGAESFAHVASKNFQTLGISDRISLTVGRFQDTLPSALSQGSVDYAYIDGHHDEHATIKYYEQFLPHLAKRATLVFDDITWSVGMSRAWQHIRNHPKVDVSFDLSNIGICLLGAGVKEQYALVLT